MVAGSVAERAWYAQQMLCSLSTAERAVLVELCDVRVDAMTMADEGGASRGRDCSAAAAPAAAVTTRTKVLRQFLSFRSRRDELLLLPPPPLSQHLVPAAKSSSTMGGSGGDSSVSVAAKAVVTCDSVKDKTMDPAKDKGSKNDKNNGKENEVVWEDIDSDEDGSAGNSSDKEEEEENSDGELTEACLKSLMFGALSSRLTAHCPHYAALDFSVKRLLCSVVKFAVAQLRVPLRRVVYALGRLPAAELELVDGSTITALAAVLLLGTTSGAGAGDGAADAVDNEGQAVVRAAATAKRASVILAEAGLGGRRHRVPVTKAARQARDKARRQRHEQQQQQQQQQQQEQEGKAEDVPSGVPALPLQPLVTAEEEQLRCLGRGVAQRLGGQFSIAEVEAVLLGGDDLYTARELLLLQQREAAGSPCGDYEACGGAAAESKEADEAVAVKESTAAAEVIGLNAALTNLSLKKSCRSSSPSPTSSAFATGDSSPAPSPPPSPPPPPVTLLQVPTPQPYQHDDPPSLPLPLRPPSPRDESDFLAGERLAVRSICLGEDVPRLPVRNCAQPEQHGMCLNCLVKVIPRLVHRPTVPRGGPGGKADKDGSSGAGSNGSGRGNGAGRALPIVGCLQCPDSYVPFSVLSRLRGLGLFSSELWTDVLKRHGGLVRSGCKVLACRRQCGNVMIADIGMISSTRVYIVSINPSILCSLDATA